MSVGSNSVVVTFDADRDARAVFAECLGDIADIAYLAELPEGERAGALRSAGIIIGRNTGKELHEGEDTLIGNARLVQFVTAGVDYIPLRQFPADLPIAANGGAYAEPMAEHAVAIMFAAAKRLLVEHKKLERGEFDQFRPNRMLAGATCGILGFGGVGVATARRMKALGLHVHAINRRGVADEPVDWMGTADQMDTLFAAADVLVVVVPLLQNTENLIGARELALMKPDAILINLARGEIIDETAFYRHLQANPAFVACIDAWWIEPVRHNRFAMSHPFLELPNVIGSPHNSASIKGARAMAYRQAAANCRRVLEGKPALHLIGPEGRMR